MFQALTNSLSPSPLVKSIVPDHGVLFSAPSSCTGLNLSLRLNLSLLPPSPLPTTLQPRLMPGDAVLLTLDNLNLLFPFLLAFATKSLDLDTVFLHSIVDSQKRLWFTCAVAPMAIL
jgi:hypothetical protein